MTPRRAKAAAGASAPATAMDQTSVPAGDTREGEAAGPAGDAPHVPAPAEAESAPAHSAGSTGAPLAGLEAALGYTFNDATLLRRALVHRSYLHDVPDYALGSNERLEFLGDAVLGFLVARRLYLRYPEKPEGELTALRGALVRLTRLSVWAGMIDLGAYLYMSRGEEAQGGRGRDTIIGRAFEALLGAIYLDGGLRVVERVLRRFLAATSEGEIAAVLSGDYKSQLQRAVQARYKVPPAYRLAETSGPAHQRLFRIGVWAGDELLGEGEGSNKRQAEQAAAQAGLARLGDEAADVSDQPPDDPSSSD
jgi:ribonuclease-3